jgi:GTP cyclohydrolase I
VQLSVLSNFQNPIASKKSVKEFVAMNSTLAKVNREQILHESVRNILEGVGEDPFREGLLDTPKRVTKMFSELLVGYEQDATELLNGALFDIEHSEMVVVSDIEFQSLCEHHMLPFLGVAHVAYVPHRKIVGLSKIPRIVEMYSRRLQVQERMTRQIAEAISTLIEPLGVGVITSASHMCSAIRGVKKPASKMTTSSMLGVFKSDPAVKADFINQISISKMIA